MSRTHVVVRGALLLGVVGAVYACDSNADVLAPRVVDPLFANSVAIGNSITAGFQSGGINDSTQRQSYAMLLARQMGTRYAYPSLTMPGCPPPLTNLLANTRVGGGTASTCALRNIPIVDRVPLAPPSLNNVAVPGFGTADVTALGAAAPAANPLAELVLGGQTMVRKALDVRPTFATVWIGNNDVLAPALSGLPAGATPLNTFRTNYAKMIDELVVGSLGVKGMLVGVGQVAGLPIMFQAGLLTPGSAPQLAATQVAGRPVILDPITCTGAGLTSLVNLQYIVAIRSRPAAQPGIVFCQKIAGGGPTDPGDAGILDPTEQVTVRTLIDGYNAYIRAKADSVGFAFYDPNVLFTSLRNSGAIPPFPNLASTTQTFGQYVSLDGVHPSGLAHQTLANEMIAVINTKYSTTLAPVP